MGDNLLHHRNSNDPDRSVGMVPDRRCAGSETRQREPRRDAPVQFQTFCGKRKQDSLSGPSELRGLRHLDTGIHALPADLLREDARYEELCPHIRAGDTARCADNSVLRKAVRQSRFHEEHHACVRDACMRLRFSVFHEDDHACLHRISPDDGGLSDGDVDIRCRDKGQYTGGEVRAVPGSQDNRTGIHTGPDRACDRSMGAERRRDDIEQRRNGILPA